MVAPAVLYAVLWPLLNVGYLAHWFPLPFQTGRLFYQRYSRVIGGPVHYAAGFFTQTYAEHWAGVLSFTLLGLVAWVIARGILRAFSNASCSWPAAAFPIAILVLVSRHLSVVFVLSMLAGLAAAWAYMALCQLSVGRTSPPAVSVGQASLPAVSVGQASSPARAAAPHLLPLLYLLASVPLYWLLGSGFLYVCALCALYEALVRKRVVWAAAWIAWGAAVPQGMSYVFYEPSVSLRYFRWMTIPQRDPITNALVVAMYLFAPVGAVVAFVLARLRVGDRLPRRLLLAVRVAGFAALALLASRLVSQRFDTSGWVYADYLREAGRPEQALDSLAQSADVGDPARFLTLFVLGRSGRLPWEMFRYPQVASSDALLLLSPTWDTNPAVARWRTDLYLELGRVNDAQRWAHESLSMEGETARVLEHAALTYVLNHNPETARTFARALGKVPLQGSRAQRYLDAMERDPSMQSDPIVSRIRPLMLRKDYVGDWTTEQVLQQCLDANPLNRMAFEYLLAHYLLMSDMNGLAGLAPRLKEFYGARLPTHVQEALLGYKNVNGSLPPGIDGSAIDPELEARFQRFIQTWSRYQNGSAEEAWRVLAPDYGATWWFFYVFNRTAAGPSPDGGAAPSPEKGRQ